MDNYYQILRISQNANTEQVKNAFWGLARKYHPDVSQDPDAEEKFQLISLAYDIVSDPEKRAKYDLLLKYGKKDPIIEPESPKHRDPKYRPKAGSYTAYRNIRKEQEDDLNSNQLSWLRMVLFVTMLIIGFSALYYSILDLNSNGIIEQERGISGLVFSVVYFSILITGWWMLGNANVKKK